MKRSEFGRVLGFWAVMVGCLVNAATADVVHVPQEHKSIQAAIDASSAGDTVLVEAGVYRERIRLKPGITVRSVGDDVDGQLGLKRAEVTVIDGGGTAGKTPGVVMAESATLDGFTIRNVGEYDDAKWKRHFDSNGNEQAYEAIGEPGVAGISILGVSCEIIHNIVHHNGATGIAIIGVKGRRCAPVVRLNFCYRNMAGGIGSMKKSTGRIETNTCFENFYAGIGHEDASPTVIDNSCYGNVRAGIGISEGACPTVRGNRCYRNRRAGIGTRTGAETSPVIENNDCYENEMAGIGISEEAAAIVRKNRCFRNRMVGIGSESGATPLIIGNECYENQLAGIGQRGDCTTVLINNYVHNNKASGLGFEACKSGHSRVLKNRIIDNELVAVGIHEGWDVELIGNELSREKKLPPIVMVFKGASAFLRGNRIRGGGVAGIRVGGDVDAVQNRIEGVEMRPTGPPNFAVWALPGSSVSLTGNEMKGWRHALHATESSVSASRNTVSDFHRTAFVVKKAVHPANIFLNTIHSSDEDGQALSIDGKSGIVDRNSVTPPE